MRSCRPRRSKENIDKRENRRFSGNKTGAVLSGIAYRYFALLIIHRSATESTEHAPDTGVDFVTMGPYSQLVDGRKVLLANVAGRYRSRLGDQPEEATRRAAKPEKTDYPARESWGLGPRKR